MELSQQEKVEHFVKFTGKSEKLAREVLIAHGWALDGAVRKYQFLDANVREKMNEMNRGDNVESSQVRGGGKTEIMTAGAVTHSETADSGLGKSLKACKLKRGLSKTAENEMLVAGARDAVLKDVQENDCEEGTHLSETPEYTFVLPNFNLYNDKFKDFLYKDLIESTTQNALEHSGRLNWWAELNLCQKLLPLATTGDGNCLLHAASLGMWGFHDRQLTLRKTLCKTLQNGRSGPLYRRWRWHQSLANQQSGLVLSETEWKNEWNHLLNSASVQPRPRTSEQCSEYDILYESLEEFHVFVLAHVLRRPVVVVADTVLKNTHGEALAPIPFGGVYLPLEIPASDCHRCPLLLTYDASHFSALVAMETPSDHVPAAIPLVSPDFKILPVHFASDPGQNFNWNLSEETILENKKSELEIRAVLEEYMDIFNIPLSNSPTHRPRSNSETRANITTEQVAPFKHHTLSRTDGLRVDRGEIQEGNVKERKPRQKFGSLGRSFSKRLRKNLGGMLRAMDISGKRKLRVDKSAINEEETPKMLLVATLVHKQASHQDLLVRNYLNAAKIRYEEEIKRSTSQLEPQSCVTPGCKGRSQQVTSYLCDKCYAEQRCRVEPKTNEKERNDQEKPVAATIDNATTCNVTKADTTSVATTALPSNNCVAAKKTSAVTSSVSEPATAGPRRVTVARELEVTPSLRPEFQMLRQSAL